MKSLRFYYLLAVGLTFGFYQIPAGAVSITFQPVAQSVNVGDSLVIDVLVSGLDSANEIVSAFDLDVTYNPSILTATGVSFGALMGDLSLFEADAGAVLTSGRVDFWEVSLLSDTELATLQSASFSVATLSFQANGAGTTALVFDPDAVPGIDVKGREAGRLNVNVSSGSVEVVPAPHAIWLFGSALAGLVGFARRKHASVA